MSQHCDRCPPVVVLQSPISDLVLHGFWSEVLLRGSWTRQRSCSLQLFEGWPDAHWIQSRRKLFVERPFTQVTPQTVQELCNFVEGSHRTGLDGRNVVNEVLLTLRSLDRQMFPTSSGFIADVLEGRRGGRQFKAFNMLYVMFCVAGLKKYEDFGKFVFYTAKVSDFAVRDCNSVSVKPTE
jgi:hypothetical protein